MRLPPPRLAQIARRARLRGAARRLARVLADPRWRCSWLPSSPRSPSVLRRAGWPRENAVKFDDARSSRTRSPMPLLAPLARWDAVWYLRDRRLRLRRERARGPRSSRSTRCWCAALATLGGGSPAALLVAAYVVALARLPRRAGAALPAGRARAGPAARAGPTLLLLAVFPAALYFGAPYSESLFLLLSVGAFYAARTGRWAWAGRLRGRGARPRAARGVLLLVPLAILWWSSRDAPRRARRGLAAARPARAGRLRALPGARGGRRAALPRRAGRLVPRVRRGRSAAPGTGSRPRLSTARASCCRAQREPVYFEQAGGRPVPDRGDQPDAVRLPGVRAWRPAWACSGGCRSPTAPGWRWRCCCRSRYPVGPQPLMSLPRFLAVLFPIFMWLALVVRGAAQRPTRGGRLRARPRPVHRAVRHLALDRVTGACSSTRSARWSSCSRRRRACAALLARARASR